MGWFETTNIGKYSSPKKARIEPWNSKNDCRSIRLINIYHFPYWVVLFVYLGGKARSFSEFQTFQSKTCRILWGVSKPVLFFGKFRWFCWNMFCFGSQIFNYSFFFSVYCLYNLVCSWNGWKCRRKLHFYDSKGADWAEKSSPFAGWHRWARPRTEKTR